MEKDFDYMQMLAGELYMASGIHKENRSRKGKILNQQFNNTSIEDKETLGKIAKELLGKIGKDSYITPPLYVDYGRHIEIGDHFYANHDCILLDVTPIKIGNNVKLAPRVSLYTAGHPIDAEVRNSELEFGLPITINDNVWIGGSATVLPGVTIGKNSIVGAGSVVTKDVPENVIVAGNPARIIREITQEDHDKWQAVQEDYFAKKSAFEKNESL